MKEGAVFQGERCGSVKNDKCDQLNGTSLLKADLGWEWSVVTFKQFWDVAALEFLFSPPHQPFLFSLKFCSLDPSLPPFLNPTSLEYLSISCH